MARSKDELRKYAEDLAKEKGLNEAQTRIGIAVLVGDRDALKETSLEDVIAAVQPIADLAVGRHADYSRAMDQAAGAKRQADLEYRRNKEWHDKAKPEWEQALADRDAATAIVRKYESTYGPLEDAEPIGGGNVMTPSGKVITIEKFEEAKAALKAEAKAEAKLEMGREVMAFYAEAERIKARHAEHFKGAHLDMNVVLAQVAKHAQEHVDPTTGQGEQISLEQAYNELHGEQISQQLRSAREDEIKRARDEGKAEGRKLAAAELARSGAAVPEDGSGIVFDRIKTERAAAAKGETPAPVDELEGAALFAQDFEEALSATNNSQ